MGRSAAGAAGSLGDVDRLRALTDGLVADWSVRARASTTSGRERAILRLLGVDGVDRHGRPLAAEIVDRYGASAPTGLAGGIGLPFSIALVEYGLTPQQLAVDVASGAIDLVMEAELLGDPVRRAAATEEARRIARSGLERVDANRTARRELVDVLGDAPRPWTGATLRSAVVGEARGEAAALARDGVDVVRIEVPIGRELASGLAAAGVDVEPWSARVPSRGSASSDLEVEGEDAARGAPTGSQRALAELRRVLDEVAAERRSYVRLATATPALAAPEQAVVAGFERVDLVEANPIAEIVTGRVDPHRALADHAFANRLHCRAGSLVVIGAGPLVVGPDLATGVPSDAATRAGRALALQYLGVSLARRDGLPVEQVVVGALPDWLVDERSPAALAIAEVTLRSVLFPGHALAFAEPPVPGGSTAWSFVLAAGLTVAGEAALVLRDRPSAASAALAVRETRTAIVTAVDIAAATQGGGLDGLALRHARATLEAAISTLEGLAGGGWPAVTGDPQTGPAPLGGGSVASAPRMPDPVADLVFGPA